MNIKLYFLEIDEKCFEGESVFGKTRFPEQAFEVGSAWKEATKYGRRRIKVFSSYEKVIEHLDESYDFSILQLEEYEQLKIEDFVIVERTFNFDEIKEDCQGIEYSIEMIKALKGSLNSFDKYQIEERVVKFSKRQAKISFTYDERYHVDFELPKEKTFICEKEGENPYVQAINYSKELFSKIDNFCNKKKEFQLQDVVLDYEITCFIKGKVSSHW